MFPVCLLVKSHGLTYRRIGMPKTTVKMTVSMKYTKACAMTSSPVDGAECSMSDALHSAFAVVPNGLERIRGSFAVQSVSAAAAGHVTPTA